ncbi:MAG TPA: hypothetical protein PKC72_11535 [Chitinophagaceae bacterium]|nr:hypothetical protein [Chitinophagaceae bacterium]
MRKLFFALLAGSALLLTGCLDTVQEITIKNDGTGTINNTSDMSMILSLLKQMGGEEFQKQMPAKLDSTFSIGDGINDMEGLSDQEKALAKNGIMKINLDMSEEKLITGLSFPFNTVSEIPVINTLSGKVLSDKMEKGMKENEENNSVDMGNSKLSSYDDYYETEYDNGSIKRKLNSEKYKTVESDEFFKGIKEAAAMGISTKATYIFNLPRPAKEVEGELVKLSDDKMKATIEFDIDDFFDSPQKLEFKIKY